MHFKFLSFCKMLTSVWMVLIVLFVVIVCLSYKLVVDFIEIGKIPTIPISKFNIIGNILYLRGSPEFTFRKFREFALKYYPLYTIRYLHVNGVCILHPDDFELVLANPIHNEKSMVYDCLKNWLRNGLLTSNGDKWLVRRKILTPAFHFRILQQFVSVFNEETENLIKTLKEHCHEPYLTVNSYVTQFTLKTIADTAMGTKLKFNTKKELDYKQAIYNIGDIIVYLLLHPIYIYKCFSYFSPKYFEERRVTKVLHKFTREVIAEREKNFQKVDVPTDDEVYIGKRRLAMLDLLLTAKLENNVIDDEGIREEVDTFMFEGHDTTAVALNFALMLMACHMDVQDKIFTEIEEVLGDVHKKPTYNDLQSMKYLEKVIKEVLRLYPSVHFISRKLGEDLITNNGYKLPKGTLAHLHIYDLHHNPEIYPDPEKFDPDRFLPERSRNRHPFAYVPFSAGPRNCIGQKFAILELKAAICGILANFILEPVDTPSTVVLVLDMVLRAKEGIKVKFVPRFE